jgi:MFS family permease
MTAQGIGGIAGGLLVGQIGKLIPQRRLIPLGLAATGLTILVIVNFPLLPVTLMLMATIGVVSMTWMVSSQTMLQMSANDQYRGRIFGAFGAVSALMSLIGMGLAGALGDVAGVVLMTSIGGGLYFIAGLMAWIMLRQAKPARTVQTISASGKLA